MLKECHKYKMKAMYTAMAGTGLVYCVKRCCKFVSVKSVTSYQDCQDASCYLECGCGDDCNPCGSLRFKNYFCSKCKPVVHCYECFRSTSRYVWSTAQRIVPINEDVAFAIYRSVKIVCVVLIGVVNVRYTFADITGNRNMSARNAGTMACIGNEHH